MENHEYTREKQLLSEDESNAFGDIQENNSSSGKYDLWGYIIGGIGMLFDGCMGIKAWKAKRALKKEREKNKVYQGIIKKHQLQIDALKSAKEREEYKNRLWAELQARMEA